MRADSEHRRLIGVAPALLIVMGLVVMLAVGLGACTDLTAPAGGLETTTTLETGATEAPSTVPASIETTTTAAPLSVSQESIDYAVSIGGTSHKGEKLYFVIGASVKTEQRAKALLEPAKGVGDMQSYFVVQLSDNFDGMTPGYWVVFEAYREYPSQENIDFGRRPFPDAYVKSATVLTDDPFPVYDDMVAGD
jgi:hypothetical protein